MTADLKLVELPARDRTAIAKDLRDLADAVEAGNWGEALNIAFVVDCGADRPEGSARIHVGLLGRAPESGATAHFLLCCAARRLENAGLEYDCEADDA